MTAKQKVDEAKQTIEDLRAKRQEALDRANAAVGTAPDEDGKIVLNAERVEDAKTALDEAKDLRTQIEVQEGILRELEWGAQPAEKALAPDIVSELKRQGLSVIEGPVGKSLSQLFTESEEFQEFKSSGAAKMDRFFQPSKEAWKAWRSGVKDVFTDLPSGTPGSFGRVDRDALVEATRRRVRVRDLFPARPTDARVIEYFRVTGYTNAASMVPERSGANYGTKPHTSLSFEGRNVVTQVIAHWEVASRNVLADEPQLRGIIDSELLYGLQLREDQQILYGSGSGNDLLGVHNDPDTQNYNKSAGPASDNKADAIRRGMTLAFLADYEPTGAVVHPNDWEDMELAKDDNGQYLLAVAVALGAEKRVWRVPIVDTPAEQDGEALVGAFGLGAQLYDREEGNIRIADQHGTFFIENAVVILAEERLALAIKRPESFVEVHLNA